MENIIKQEFQTKATALGLLKTKADFCTKCEISKRRKNAVLGDGNPDSKMLFVGEAPGANEDTEGIPFTGRSGQFLQKCLYEIGLVRNRDFYITNVVKCRPDNNRNPTPEECLNCEPFLNKQIRIINPRIVIAIGKFAANYFAKTKNFPIMKNNGEIYIHDKGFKWMPIMHPAYVLRNNKKEIIDMFKKTLSKILIVRNQVT